MEVKNVSTSATSKVGDILIKYTIDSKNSKKEMRGYAYKDDEMVGSMNYSEGGALGISFNDGTLDLATQKAVTMQVLADAEELNAVK